MTQTIKLELPTGNASVLHHMGIALQSIANEGGYVNFDKEVMDKVIDDNMSVYSTGTQVPVDISKGESKLEEVTAHEEQKSPFDDGSELYKRVCEQNADDDEDTPPIEETIESVSPPLDVDHNLDKNGIPWDSRIHSRGKTRNADDTWRNARCPKDKTAEEWTAYIAEVETELKALMDIPVATTVAIEPTTNDPKYWRNPEMGSCGEVNGEEELTEFLNKFPNAEPITHEQFVQFQAELDADDEVVEAPLPTPPIVTPPLPTPPVVEVEDISKAEFKAVPAPSMEQITGDDLHTDHEIPKNFGELMKFITTNNKKLTSEAVKQVLADQGLASIALLAPRPDLIPQVHAKLVELL